MDFDAWRCFTRRLDKNVQLRQMFQTCSTLIEQVHEIPNNVVCVTSKASDQPVHTHSLIRAFASRLNILRMLSYWLNTIWSF